MLYVTETHKTSSSHRLNYLVKGYLTRILSLQIQYGERVIIYELVCPVLSPMSRVLLYNNHIIILPPLKTRLYFYECQAAF